MAAMKGLRARVSALLDRYYESVPPYRLQRIDKLLSVLLGCLFFVLYLITCSRQPNIAGDSPELIAGSYSLGVVHPPGYPLYTMLGYAVTHIPVGSVAFRLNCSSAALHALTLALLFAVMMKITRSRAASFIAASALGVSYLFWFYSLVAEVFPLHHLFVVALLLLAVMARERGVEGDGRKERRLFLLMAFIAGLSLTNHQTVLLVFPSLVLFCPRTFARVLRRPRYLALAAAVFLLGLLPYAYLPLRAAQEPYLNFGKPSTFSSFLEALTRRYYGTTKLWRGPDAVHRLDLVFDFLKTLNQEVFLFGILLGLAGMLQMARKRRGDFVPLITAFLLAGVAFPMMANVVITEIFHVSTIERFYILPTIIFSVFMAMGLAELQEGMSRLASRRERGGPAATWLPALALATVAVAFLVPAISTSRDVSLREDHFSQSYTSGLLESMEPGAVVFCSGDPPIELIDEYYTVINGYQGEAITITWSFFGQKWYMDGLRKWRPELNLPEDPESLSLPGDSFDQYRARLAYRLILDNPHIPGFYILVRDPELDRYAQMLPHGMAYKILPEDASIDYDSYYGFLMEYWNGIDRRGLDASSYRGNRREVYMINVISSYANSAGERLASASRHAEAVDLFRVALDLYPTIETELSMAACISELDMPATAELLYLDALNHLPPWDPLFWQAAGDLEAVMGSEVGR